MNVSNPSINVKTREMRVVRVMEMRRPKKMMGEEHTATTPASLRSLLRDVRAVGVDKDGCLIDNSLLNDENRRRGFERAGLGYDFDAAVTYKLGGVSNRFNKGPDQIKALLAVNRHLSSMPGAGITPNELLHTIIIGKDAERQLDRLIQMHIRDSDTSIINEIYWWDKGAFYNSEEALPYLKAYPGARDAIRELHQTLDGRVAIVTNTPTRRAVYRDLTKVLEFEGEVAERIVVISGEEVTERKPSPQGLNLAMASLGVRPGETAYVGDTRTDIETARNAGTIAVALLSGQGTELHLNGVRPDMMARDIVEFAGMLRDAKRHNISYFLPAR